MSEAEPVPEAAPPPPEAEALQRELERLGRELAEMRERWLRARADYENLSKRAAKEREEAWRTAGARLVEALLPAYEALEAAAREDDGVRRVHEALRRALEGEGLAAIDDAGAPFDVERHEAVERAASTAEPGTVLETVRRGYALNGAVVRPAQVRVAAPLEPPREQEGEHGTHHRD